MKETSIKLKTKYGEYMITVEKTDMSITEVFEELIEPLLKAAGYSDDVIRGLQA